MTKVTQLAKPGAGAKIVDLSRPGRAERIVAGLATVALVAGTIAAGASAAHEHVTGNRKTTP